MQVWLNMAMTLDGSVKDASGSWKPSKDDRLRMDEIRAQCDALLIGTGTLIADNPNVFVKHAPEKSPLPVLLLRNTLPDPGLRIFRGVRRPLILSRQNPGEYPADWLQCDPEPDQVLRALSARGIERLLLEGGPHLASSFLSADLIDRFFLTIVPRLAASAEREVRIAARIPMQFRLESVERRGDDVFLEYLRAGSTPGL